MSSVRWSTGDRGWCNDSLPLAASRFLEPGDRRVHDVIQLIAPTHCPLNGTSVVSFGTGLPFDPVDEFLDVLVFEFPNRQVRVLVAPHLETGLIPLVRIRSEVLFEIVQELVDEDRDMLRIATIDSDRKRLWLSRQTVVHRHRFIAIRTEGNLIPVQSDVPTRFLRCHGFGNFIEHLQRFEKPAKVSRSARFWTRVSCR